MIDLIKSSYGDAFRLVRTMLPAVVYVILIGTIAGMVGQALGETTQSPLGETFLTIMVSLAGAYFAAPFNVALMQALVGRETVPTRRFVGTEHARLYFAWAGMIALAIGMLDVLPALAFAAENTGRIMPGSFAASLVAMIIQFIISVRLVTLLPGVAMEGRAMTLKRALGETSGHFWFIAFASFLTILPLIFILGLLIVMVPPSLVQAPVGLFMPVLTMPVTFVFFVIYLALSARLYRRFSTGTAPT